MFALLLAHEMLELNNYFIAQFDVFTMYGMTAVDDQRHVLFHCSVEYMGGIACVMRCNIVVDIVCTSCFAQ